ERKELIQKVKSPIDTRSYVIALTSKGKQLAAVTSSFSQPIQQPIEQLSAGQKEELLASLVKVISQLNGAGVINVQRMCFNCAHYRPQQDGHAHFCNLLNTPLEPSQLRVDCKEHQPA
ncbi:MAG: MarR family transcriptional regulator, partial [Flavobacteriales bacterium]